MSISQNPHELGELGVTGKIEGPVIEVTGEKVKTALETMKKRKEPGPLGLSGDICKAAGKAGIVEIMTLFEEVQNREEMPAEWGDRG